MSRFVLLLFMIFLCDTMYCAEANTAYVDSLIASGKTYLDQEYNSHAINLLLRAERIAKKNNNLSQLAEIYTLFASIYERNVEFKQSLEYQKKLNEVISTLAELKIQEVINNNDMITLDQHNQEIHDLKLKKRDNLLFLYLLIAGVICVGTIIMCLSSRRNKIRLQNLLNEQTRDIEKKNKALQEQIKKKHASEQKFKALFDSSTDSIFIHDPEDMRIVDVNKRTCDTYGYSREEMLSMNINDLSSTSMLTVDSPEAREFIHRLYNGELIKKEWEAKAKDGTLFWLDINAIIIKLDDKDRLLIFARNIDDKKRFQKELEESRALLHSIIHNLPVACYAYDKERKIIVQSAQSIQRWGNLIGRKDNVIHADMKNIDNELIERWNNLRDRVYDGEEINDEYTLKINDDIEYIQMRLIPLESNDEIIGILGVDIDITEIRKNEQKLLYLNENLEKMVETEIEKRKYQQEIIVQKSKLESLGQLAAGIAHEINQPIGPVSYTHLRAHET